MTALTVTAQTVFVGDVQSGKTYQAATVFNAQDEDGSYPFRPALVITCEGAARVSAASMITSPDCVHYEAGTPEEVTQILEQVFPDGHNGQPFAMVFFDGWSVLQERTKMDAQRVYQEEGNLKAAEDQRQLTNRAAARMRPTIAAWQSAAALPQAHGCAFFSTCHVAEEWRAKVGSKDYNDRHRVGLKLDIAPSVYKALHREIGSIIYLLAVLPDIGTLSADATDEELATVDRLNREGVRGAVPARFALAQPCMHGGDQLTFIKHQEGLFATGAVPFPWRDPNFGEAFRTSPLRRKKTMP